MTLPINKNTRPLTRRQRAAMGMEPNPYAWPGKTTRKQKRVKATPQTIKEKHEKLSLRERLELSERQDKTAAWMKTVSREQWQQWMREGLEKIEEDERLEKIRRRELATQERKDKRRNRSKRYYQEFYGPSWFPVQAEAMVRSNGICEICRISKADHVHHILPIRYFADSEDAHYINNTLAVCVPCHNQEHRQMKRRFPLFNHLKLNLCRPGRVGAPNLRFTIVNTVE